MKKYRRRERNLGQRHRKYFQQNHRRKLPQPKEGRGYQSMRSIQNTKKTEPEQIFFLALTNQKTKCTEQRKTIKGCQGKTVSNV